MATINYCILKHQKNKDGCYPIRIRIIHQNKSKYIPTKFVASENCITEDYKIKSNEKALLADVLKIVTSYNKLLKKIDTRNKTLDEITNYLINTEMESMLRDVGDSISDYSEE